MNPIKIIRRLFDFLRLVADGLCGLVGVHLLPAPFVGVRLNNISFARRIATSGFV
jgi:hypothetical protein